MLGREFKRASRLRRAKPLVVRGGLARTFGGLASFLAVIFLAWGTYVLDDAFANPIAAQAAAVIAAAFSIALATILLFYLLKPGKNFSGIVPQDASRVVSSTKQSIFRESSKLAREEDSRRDLAYQRTYVDHSRISPRVHI
jgi:hypothetical protein